MAEEGFLSPAEQARYARHLSLPEIGAPGQARLKSSRVLLVGAGGLGSPISLYLAAAGVGQLGIVDFDRVDASNLQRQVIFDTTDIGEPKAEACAARLRALNPDIEVQVFDTKLSADNVESLVKSFDVVVDGTDNQATRYLLNDVCYWLKTPLVYGSIYRFEGQASVFNLDQGPCYRCLFPNRPGATLAADCSVAGVLGVLPAIIGSLQATETIKLLTGIGDPLNGRLLLYNALSQRFDELSYQRRPDCPVCGTTPKIRNIQDSLASLGEVSSEATAFRQISADELKLRIETKENLQLVDVRSIHEREQHAIQPSMHIPLNEVALRAEDLDPSREIILYCQTGGRSAQACAQLTAQGFEEVYNLAGGINAWDTVSRAKR